MFRLGFDVGGTNIAAGLVDESFRVTERLVRPFPKGENGEYFVSLLRQMAEQLCAQAGLEAGSLPQLGVALPGSLDASGQRVIHAHNLDFHDLPLGRMLRDKFPRSDIRLLNDGDAATEAELKAGALRGCRWGILLTLGTGVGGGLVCDGRLFRGGRGRGTEPGHMLLHKGGRLCTCGQRGCVEQYCSASALSRDGIGAAQAHPDSLLARLSGEQGQPMSARLVVDCARAGDETAKALFEQYVDELSSYLASLVDLLDPEVIALGGGLGQSGEFLCEPLRRLTAEKCFFHSCGLILPAQMGNDAGIIGAAWAEG